MNGRTANRNYLREHVAARLTEVVYPVVLRHTNSVPWLDLELDLWKTLTEELTGFSADLPVE